MIEGIEGREPVLARLNIGERDNRGIPRNFVGNDLVGFTFMVPHAAKDGGKWHADPHPKFGFFNHAEPRSKRYSVQGVLVHATQDDCFEYQLKAQKISGLKSGNKAACIGDGVSAQRWDDGSGDYLKIQCPHEKCQYRLTDPAACKPWMRLLFQVRWPGRDDLPTGLIKLVSQSWNTIANAKGFFERIETSAKLLGLSDYRLFGLPFTLTLVKHTSEQKKSRFPVVHFSADLGIEQFLLRQHDLMLKIGASYASLEDMSDPQTVYEDTDAIEFPRSKS